MHCTFSGPEKCDVHVKQTLKALNNEKKKKIKLTQNSNVTLKGSRRQFCWRRCHLKEQTAIFHVADNKESERETETETERQRERGLREE